MSEPIMLKCYCHCILAGQEADFLMDITGFCIILSSNLEKSRGFDLASYLESNSIKFVIVCKFVMSFCRPFRTVFVFRLPTSSLHAPRKDALVWSKAGAEQLMFLCILCGVSEMTCIARDDFQTKPGDSACNPLQRCLLNFATISKKVHKAFWFGLILEHAKGWFRWAKALLYVYCLPLSADLPTLFGLADCFP